MKVNADKKLEGLRAEKAVDNKPSFDNKDLFQAEGTSRSVDKIKVSNRANTVNKLVDELKQTPDVRVERVKVLRQQIQAGEYYPPSQQIASAVLRDRF